MNSATGPDRVRHITEQLPVEADLESWIGEYGDGLLRLCYLQLGDHALAEDALQETFVRAWQNYDRFEHRSSVKTWITAIAINVCRSMQRSPWRRRVIGLDSIPELSTEQNMPDPTVSLAVMKLPPELKEVLLLHDLQDMKIREIAEARRLPMGTVSSRLNRARKRLRRKLKEWYSYEEK